MSSDHLAAPDPAPDPRHEDAHSTADELTSESAGTTAGGRRSGDGRGAADARDVEARRDLAASLEDFPLLDRDGMIAGRDEAEEPAAVLADPSLLLPAVVAGLGVLLTVLSVAETVRFVPADGQARPLTVPLLAAALALGGFSLTRLLQLLLLARSRARARAAGAELPEVRWQLIDAHSLHAVWVIGVGASIALMGALGVWSELDGAPSGLEPGWPLVAVGGGVALLAHRARQRTERCWVEAGDAD